MTIKKELEVGKELSEVADAVAKLVADLKAKKELAVVVAESLPGLMAAIQGYDQLDDEIKSSAGIDSLLYAASELAKALKG